MRPTIESIIRLLIALGWVLFTVWLFIYRMPISGLHALLGLWVIIPGPLPQNKTIRWLMAGGILSAAIITVPVIGLPEYTETTNDFHCRTLGFLGTTPSHDCNPDAVERGREIAEVNGELFSLRERIAIHGFNYLLAIGGLPFGFFEAAEETARMFWASNPLPPEASVTERREQCRASYTDNHAQLAESVSKNGDFPMRSPSLRQALAKGIPRLPKNPGATLNLGEIHFIKGSSNNTAYRGALLEGNLWVAMALEVGDSQITLQRRSDLSIDVHWTGTIHYPNGDIAFTLALPTLWGPRILRVSETVFCGMHIDGAMNPYRLSYQWQLSPDDPRL